MLTKVGKKLIHDEQKSAQKKSHISEIAKAVTIQLRL